MRKVARWNDLPLEVQQLIIDLYLEDWQSLPQYGFKQSIQALISVNYRFGQDLVMRPLQQLAQHLNAMDISARQARESCWADIRHRCYRANLTLSLQDFKHLSTEEQVKDIDRAAWGGTCQRSASIRDRVPEMLQTHISAHARTIVVSRAMFVLMTLRVSCFERFFWFILTDPGPSQHEGLLQGNPINPCREYEGALQDRQTSHLLPTSRRIRRQ